MYRMTLTLVNLTGNDPVCNGERSNGVESSASDNFFSMINKRTRDSGELRTDQFRESQAPTPE